MNRNKRTWPFLASLLVLLTLLAVGTVIGRAGLSGSTYLPQVRHNYLPPETVLTLLHTNDAHGRLQADTGGQWWGYARVATLIEQVRGSRESVLLLDAGDVLHGTNIANLFQGESVVDVMNAMGYDAWTLGNHDFNYGQTVLMTRTLQADFPALAANLVVSGTTTLPPFAVESLVKEIGELKVAIFGLVTPDTVWATHPNNVQGLQFLDPVTTASALVPILQTQADVVIALTHLGYDQDVELAQQVEGIDVIVGGHSHTRLDVPEVVNGTIVVQANEYAKVLGQVDLHFRGKTLVGYNGWLNAVTESVAQEPNVKAIIDDYADQLAEELNQTVGESLVYLDGERAHVRTGETNLGNLITDAMREGIEADVAFTNGGGIRASIITGTITLGNVYTVLPFDNFLVSIDLTGAQLLEALEHGLRSYPAQLGGFPHISGMAVRFDPAQEPGDRVVSVEVAGQPLDLQAVYSVATNDFMAAGGDDYTMFLDGTNYVDSGLYLRDVVADYITRNSPISPVIEGRITTATMFTILHMNDAHGRLQPDSGGQWWGYARIADLVANARQEQDAILLLDAGDVLHGTNIANLFQGESVVDVMNAMDYDAWTLGNHDFNYGQTVLLTRTLEAEFAALAANVVVSGTAQIAPFATEFVTKEVGGLVVGIFGLVTPDTVWATHPNNVQGLQFLDPVTTATALVPELLPQVDVVIALTHIGYDADVELAEQVDGIDVIIGGHSHTKIETLEVVNGTIIAQAHEYGKFLGRVDLFFHGTELVGHSGMLIPVTQEVAEDATVKALIDGYASQLAEELNETVGETLVFLDGERAHVRTGETNLGNLITDALREGMETDVAFTNGGGIRASIITGTITLGDVYTVLPFDNYLVSIDLTGAQLVQALEHGLRSYPAQLGGFPHISGMAVVFDPAQDAGSRVVSVTVGGQAIDLGATYSVATNDFMAAGGDDYAMFLEGTNYTDSGLFLRDVVADYIRLNTPVNPGIEGRITTPPA